MKHKISDHELQTLMLASEFTDYVIQTLAAVETETVDPAALLKDMFAKFIEQRN